MPERIERDDGGGGAVRNLDVWSFTSPRAKREFDQQGKLDELEKDIVDAVLEGGDWTDQDRQYLDAVNRLVKQGALEEKAAYWYCSPHPPTYRALEDGEILGKRFQAGQDIVYQPAKNVERENKLIIGKFQTTTETQSHRGHMTGKQHM